MLLRIYITYTSRPRSSMTLPLTTTFFFHFVPRHFTVVFASSRSLTLALSFAILHLVFADHSSRRIPIRFVVAIRVRIPGKYGSFYYIVVFFFALY